MLIAFTRYSRDSTFGVLREDIRFVLLMSAGSIAGAFLGGAALTVAGPGPHRSLGPDPARLGRQGLAPR